MQFLNKDDLQSKIQPDWLSWFNKTHRRIQRNMKVILDAATI